jgi:energy-coupling factor transporter transmembrane protein EcfT
MSERLRRAQPGRAFHYRDTGSPLHRLGAGWKLAVVAIASAAAVAPGDPWLSAALLAGVGLGWAAARLSAAELWQDARWLVAQGCLIVALSCARDGSAGIPSGARAALQIAAFFLPGALLLRTTPTAALLAGLRRVLPRRVAFAFATSLRFVPALARELHEIAAAQRLRGARLAARDLWRPRAWLDWIECVGVPLAVRAIHTANEAALAAEVRGMGRREEDP